MADSHLRGPRCPPVLRLGARLVVSYVARAMALVLELGLALALELGLALA
jgi:hypothetical protein